MHPKLGVPTVRVKRPDPPAHDRFGEGPTLGPDAGLEKLLAHGEGAVGSVVGTGSGAVVGTGSAWGIGSDSGSGRISGTGIEIGSTSKTRLGRPMFIVRSHPGTGRMLLQAAYRRLR